MHFLLDGCTKNNCNEKGRLNPRSVVFVTALEDATLYIDYDNDKKIDDEVPIKYLGSVRVIDSDDTDMTGAVMYAKNKDGDFVDLAAGRLSDNLFVSLFEWSMSLTHHR